MNWTKISKALLLAALLTGCAREQPEPQPAAPQTPPKTYRVIQNGKVCGVHLTRTAEGYGLAEFKTKDGRRVVFHGTFWYEEEKKENE